MIIRQQQYKRRPGYLIPAVFLLIGILFIGRIGNKFLFSRAAFATQNPNISHSKINDFLPLIRPHEEIVKHFAYTLSYSEKFEQAKWVAYELRASYLKGYIKRAHKFISDPYVKTGSALPSDYTNSGFDKGHLAPAGDMKWSFQAMQESFYMSNVSPQAHSLNCGVWEQLEEAVRSKVLEDTILYIVTGPVLSDSLSRKIGSSGVRVPAFFYKVIYSPVSNNGIGFIIPNSTPHVSYQHYAMTIDSVEKVTGIDFYYKLNNPLQIKAESNFSLSGW